MFSHTKKEMPYFSQSEQKNLSTYFNHINIDDAKKSTVSYTVSTHSQWHLHNIKRMDLTESNSVVPAEYLSKVKLELFTILEC